MKGGKDDIEKFVTKVIEDSVAKLGENDPDDDKKAKSEAAMKKQFF